MNLKKVCIAVLGSVALASCSSMGIVSTPSQYVKAGKEVNVVKKNSNVLGLSGMDVHKESKLLLDKLKAKCPSGVTNIRTSHNATPFLFIMKEKLEMSGNCK